MRSFFLLFLTFVKVTCRQSKFKKNHFRWTDFRKWTHSTCLIDIPSSPNQQQQKKHDVKTWLNRNGDVGLFFLCANKLLKIHKAEVWHHILIQVSGTDVSRREWADQVSLLERFLRTSDCSNRERMCVHLLLPTSGPGTEKKKNMHSPTHHNWMKTAQRIY